MWQVACPLPNFNSEVDEDSGQGRTGWTTPVQNNNTFCNLRIQYLIYSVTLYIRPALEPIILDTQVINAH